jgi:hypothetical protein
MFEHFQSHVPNFRTRLSETVAWCSAQPLESDPEETHEIQERRKMGEHAARLSRRAYVSRGPGFWKSLLKRRANQLWAIAKLHEIVPLTRQLRSPSLRPSPFGYPQAPAERVQIVEAVAEKRATQLHLEHRYPLALVGDLAGGRLLKYAPSENLCDGAAQYSTKGFFDVDNIPPWDTWICFIEPYLISWVPPRLLDLANTGIDANPEQCILWAREK